MKKTILCVIIMMTSMFMKAQMCPGTLANQTTSTDPFFKIDQGTTNCADWPMTIIIDGSTFEQTSCNGANLEYTLVSGAPLADPNNFVADFGFGECTYVNGALAGQTLSIEEIASEKLVMYPNPTTKATDVHISFGQQVSGTVQLFGANGQLFQNIQIKHAEKMTINTANLAKGIYFLQILTKREKISKKLIVY